MTASFLRVHSNTWQQSYELAYTSPPPLPLGNSRVRRSPAPLKEMGSKTNAARGGESDYLQLVHLRLRHKLRLHRSQGQSISL